MKQFRTLPAAACIAIGVLQAASAQTATRPLPLNDAEAVKTYRLTDGNFKRLSDFELEAARDPCVYKDANVTDLALLGNPQAVQILTHRLQHNRYAQPYLVKNGLTEREAVVGGFAIFIARMGADAKRGRGVEMAGIDTPAVQDNIRFVEARQGELDAFTAQMSAATQARLHAGACNK